MTRSSKKSNKTSVPHLPQDDDDTTQDNMPRTQDGTFSRTNLPLTDEKEESSHSSPSSSSSNDGTGNNTDSHGRSHYDPKDVGSEISTTSSKKDKKKKKRNRKKNKKGEETQESEVTYRAHKVSEMEPFQNDDEEYGGNQLLQSLHQMNANISVISEQVQALATQVNEHSKALSKTDIPKPNDRNPFFQQLALATEDVDWRDIIPRKLQLNDLSAVDNINQVNRSDNVAGRNVNPSPSANVNISPLNNKTDSTPNNMNPPNRDESASNTHAEHTDKYISKVYNDLDNSTVAARRNQVVIMRQEKECSVKIRKLELGTVATAVREILEFQEVEQTPVNMMKVLDASVRDYLKIKYKVSPEDFRSWEVSDLLKIMARETIVSSTIAFHDQLKSTMADKKVMPWSAVNPQNHERFYLQQVRFVDEFKTVLKLMLAGNSRYCPLTNLKKYGLLNLFKSINNPDYFEHIYFGALASQKYDNMFKFLDAYLKAIHDQYQVSIVIKDLPYEFNKQLKTQRDKSRQDAYYQSKRDITKQLDKKTDYKFKSSNRTSRFNQSSSGSYRDRKELNHISSTIDDDEDDEHDPWRNVGPEGSTQDYQDEDSVSIASNETKSDDEDINQQDNIANTANDDFDQQLAAMESSSHPNSGKNNSSGNSAPYACLKKILTGKCEKPNCTYDHNPHRLREAAQDVVTKANTYLKAQESKPASSKPNLMVRDKGKFNR